MSERPDERQAWAAYWALADDAGCLPGAPEAVRALLTGVWSAFAATLPAGAAVLDIASGAGAVIKALRAQAPGLAVTGIDYAAVGDGAARLGVRGGIDAEALAFPDDSFDAVTSQFGIEYCGEAAWRHVARVLRPGGRVTFICHAADSQPVMHNRARLAAMRALEAAGLFTLAADLTRGLPEDRARAGAIAAARAAHAAQRISEELPQALGQALRSGDRMTVAVITRKARGEMARLQAMAAAALDAKGAAARLALMRSKGVALEAERLADAQGQAVAWVLATS